MRRLLHTLAATTLLLVASLGVARAAEAAPAEAAGAPYRPQLELSTCLGTNGGGLGAGLRIRWIAVEVLAEAGPFSIHTSGGLRLFATPGSEASAYAYGRAGQWSGESSFSEADGGRYGNFGVGIDASLGRLGFFFVEVGAGVEHSRVGGVNGFELDARLGVGLSL